MPIPQLLMNYEIAIIAIFSHDHGIYDKLEIGMVSKLSIFKNKANAQPSPT